MTTFIFGEAMLEYHSHGGSGLRYGGDTLNTAIHMARKGCDVAYVTAVGTDPVSDALVKAWEAEGVDTRHVHRHPERSPGIYAIHLDRAGERSFLYWRDTSAARDMFRLPAMAKTLAEAAKVNLVYYSLISLAIVGATGRAELIALSRKRKADGLAVAYDSNFRPALWDDLAQARDASMAAVEAATIGLPTNVDEQQLFGEEQSNEAIARRWRDRGCTEVILKTGEKGCLYMSTERTTTFLSEAVNVVDSSGAGDAFNAGFLTARLAGEGVEDSIWEAQHLARETLGHLGAIRPLDEAAAE